LFGGLIGASLVVGGPGAVHFDSILVKVIMPAVIAPVLAGLLALAATFLTYRATARADAENVRRRFKVGQVVSASTVALAHGANDAQKTMGVITLTLITAGALAPGAGPPSWVILAAGMAMALGTYMGGWRIIRTLGQRVSDIQTTQGFTAETTSAAVILTSTHLGIPLSTTQVCAGAIYGAGAGRRLTSVHWGLAGQMAIGWALTLPAAAVVGAAASWLAAHGAAGVFVVAASSLALGAGIYAAARRNAVTALNVNDVPLPPPVRLAA
jgi:PiT family inorganic phosphate transporter